MKNSEQIKKYRDMKESDLEKELSVLELQATKNSLGVLAGKIANFSQVSKVKKDIARVKTILKEREII